MYTSLDYGNLSSSWALVDRVLLQYGGEAPSDDRPGTVDILPGRPFEVYLANLSSRPILYTKRLVVASMSKAPDCIVLR